MRKVFAISILCCLLFLSGGYHLFYYLRIREAKLEMKRSLLSAKNEQLVCFEFSSAELASLHWEDANEFHYGNEMYDVLKRESNQGKTKLFCVSDKKEKTLLEAYLKTQKQSSRTSSNTIAKLLTTVFLLVHTTPLSSPEETSIEKRSRFYFFIPQRSTLILIPPPKVS